MSPLVPRMGPGHAQPAPPEVVLDALAELGAIRQLIAELVDQAAGEVIAVPRRVVLDAEHNPVEFVVDGPGVFHAVKIDNPSAVAVEVQFASGANPIAAESDERIPAQTGRIITRPFDVVSVGIDPANLPAGRTTLFVTYYSRPLPPTTYAFAP